MVFDGLQIGGVERVGADYAKMLCQMGHDVTIVNLRPKAIIPGNLHLSNMHNW